MNYPKLILRIVLLVGTVASMFFVLWPIFWAWIAPQPDTVQAQVDEAIDHGFDGMIVYVDQAGKAPGFYAAGWHAPPKASGLRVSNMAVSF